MKLHCFKYVLCYQKLTQTNNDQGRIHKYGLVRGGHEWVGSRPLPSPRFPLSFLSPPPSLPVPSPFPSCPLPLEVGPLNPARESLGAL